MKTALAHKRRLAALRLLCSPPRINPAAARLHPLVPTWDPWRTTSHRQLLRPLNGSTRPPRWSSAPSGGRRHLPLDNIAYSVRLFLPSRLPLAAPHLVSPTPYDPTGIRPYNELKAAARSFMISEWSLAAPTPPYYLYSPSIVPPAFAGLPRFMAGRIHQMRAGKSYLAAHQSWSSSDQSPLCPSCEEADETFEHAILHCPAKATEREAHLQGVTELGFSSPVWSSVPALLGLSRYISSTATGFPPAMPALASPAPSSLAPSSPRSTLAGDIN